MTDIEDLTDLFKVVEGCCLHNPVFKPEDVAEVLYWKGDHYSQSESSSLVIVKLLGGDYGMFDQSEDYTGHGCMCGSATLREHKLANLLTGLDNWDVEEIVRTGEGEES